MIQAKKIFIIYVCVAFLINFPYVILQVTHQVTLSYSGFGLDSSGVLYIGTDSSIEKYLNGEQIGKILKPSRGYAFAVQNDDTILLSTASIVYTMDLDGNILTQREDIGTETFNQLQKKNKLFLANDGKTYRLKLIFGRTCVVSEEGEMIYQMPLLDYIASSVFFCSIFANFIVIPIIVYKWRKGS